MINYQQKVEPTLSFGEAITRAFKNYATFTGRARRSEYWWFVLLYLGISALIYLAQMAVLMQSLDSEYPLAAIESPAYKALTFLFAIVGIGLFLPTLSVTIRRFHDIGKSGWSWLWVLIPIVGLILCTVWMCQDSDVGANRYGPSPKYLTYSHPATTQTTTKFINEGTQLKESGYTFDKPNYQPIEKTKSNSSLSKTIFIIVALALLALVGYNMRNCSGGYDGLNIAYKNDVSMKFLNDSEINSMSHNEKRLLRNFVYAKYGYVFQDKQLQHYFEQFDWYNGTTMDQQVIANKFNVYEKENVRKLANSAKKALRSGYYYFVGHCNIRQSPSSNSPVVGTAEDGVGCYISGEHNGNWYWVDLGEFAGWTSRSNLQYYGQSANWN